MAVGLGEAETSVNRFLHELSRQSDSEEVNLHAVMKAVITM